MTVPFTEPIEKFQAWLEDAGKANIKEPTAMCLATTTPEGIPSARMVLLKEADERGFTFYTNLESRKGSELAANPRAALCFYWAALDRQVRVEGKAEPVSEEEADGYFASRALKSRIGAWASRQSRPMAGKRELMKRVAEFTAKFAVGDVPRPPHWSGFRIVPERIEFWQQGAFRLHDRKVYTREGDGWQTEVLYP